MRVDVTVTAQYLRGTKYRVGLGFQLAMSLELILISFVSNHATFKSWILHQHLTYWQDNNEIFH